MKKILSVLFIFCILTACLFTLVSCDNIPNEDPAEAREELLEEEYTVVDGKSSASKYGFSGLVTSIHAYKEYDSVTIFYFEDGEKANVGYGILQKTIRDEREAYQKDGIVYPDLGLEIGVSGNMVWIGTPDAISDAS